MGAEPPGTGERGCLGMATEYRGGAVLSVLCGWGGRCKVGVIVVDSFLECFNMKKKTD